MREPPDAASFARDFSASGPLYAAALAGNDSLAAKHAYLAALARLLVHASLAGRPVRGEELESVLTGAWFSCHNIENLGGEPSGLVGEAWLAVSRRLARYAPEALEQDVLGPLYERLVAPEVRHGLGEHYTPDWLAGRIVDRAFEGFAAPSVLDPSCGSGTFLRAAIAALRKKGLPLAEILARVSGIDVHPLAVLVARANYVLAIRDLLPSAARPVHIPVVQADALLGDPRPVDIVVGNPPWLTLGRTERATAFLERYAGEARRAALVMPRNLLTAAHHGGLREGRGGLGFDVTEIWDLAGVDPLFPVPAAVLFTAAGAPDPLRRKPGLRLTGRPPALTTEEVAWELAFLGRRSTWRIAGRAVQSGSGDATHYSKLFRQGAILYPQTLLVVRPEAWEGATVRIAGEPDAAREAKRCREARVDHRVEAASLYSTAAADHILPFSLAEDLWTVVLPAAGFDPLDAEGLRREGRPLTAAWLDWAEEEWRRTRKAGDATPLWRRLDHLGHLRAQGRRERHLVLYTAAGRRPVAACLDTAKTRRPFVARDRTFWASFADPREAHYLCAFLNSDFAAAAILDWMNRGLFGPRDINKRVLDVTFPSFDAGSPAHLELARLGEELAGEAARLALQAPGRSVGRRRTWLRDRLPRESRRRVEDLVSGLAARTPAAPGRSAASPPGSRPRGPRASR